MEPLSIISLISLVFSVIATGAEMAITQHQNNQNIQLQQDTLHEQQEYATQAAERANDTTVEQYNLLYSPAARRKQLDDANLSVGLMYGGGGSIGQGSTAAQAATPATSLPYMNPLLQPGQMGNIMNALKTITEAENTQAGTRKTEEETKNLEKMREQIDKEIEKADADIKWIEEKAKTEVVTRANTELQNELLKIQRDYENKTMLTRIKICEESLNKIIAEEEETWEKVNSASIDNTWKPKLYQAQIDNLEAQKAKLGAEKMLTLAQEATEYTKQALNNSQAELNDQQKAQIQSKIKEVEALAKKTEAEADIQEARAKRYRAGEVRQMEASDNALGQLIGAVSDLIHMIDEASEQ